MSSSTEKSAATDIPIEQPTTLYYDAGTLVRVYDSMREAGVGPLQAQEALTAMQKNGILFREEKKP